MRVEERWREAYDLIVLWGPFDRHFDGWMMSLVAETAG